MKDLITPSGIIGQKIATIVKKKQIMSGNFVYYNHYVQLEHNWLEIDSRGVEKKTDLYWTPAIEFIDNKCESVFDALIGLTVYHVVVSDYLPTFALVLSNCELLYSADLGPPFNAFGPLHGRLGSFYKVDEMIDFWERKPIESCCGKLLPSE